MESLSSGKPGLSQAKLHDLLQCSICLDPFTRPKVLPCQHTYCYSCLFSITAGEKIITCPQCRKVHQIPENGIKGLPDNLIINNLLGLQEENSIVNLAPDLYADTVLCLDCQNGPSVSSCDHCGQKLCSSCLVKHAKLSTQIESNMSDLRETLASERHKCSDHVKKNFELMYAEQEKIDKGFDKIIEEVEKRRLQFHGYFGMLEMLYQDVLDDWLSSQVRLEDGEDMDTSDNAKGTGAATTKSDEKMHFAILDFEKPIREIKTCAELESLKLKMSDIRTALKLVRDGEVMKFVWEGVELGRLARLEAGQAIVRIEGHYNEEEAEHSGRKWVHVRNSENDRMQEMEMNAEQNDVQRPAAETSNENRLPKNREACDPVLKVGDQVRVKAGVSSPRYRWAGVTPTRVGTVRKIIRDELEVAFPGSIWPGNWRGTVSEIDVVKEGTNGGGQNTNVHYVEPVPRGTSNATTMDIGDSDRRVIKENVQSSSSTRLNATVQLSSSSDRLKIGDCVRVKPTVSKPVRGWGDVTHASVGVVMSVFEDGRVIIDFPENKNWNGFEDEMELVPETNSCESLKVGDVVRVKASVSEPRGKWGKVTHSSVGRVQANKGGKLKVDFPEQSDWNGFADEMELIPDLVPMEPELINVKPKAKLKVGDLVRVKRSVSKPIYGWGSCVTHASVGTVVCVVNSSVAVGETVKVDFPERGGWYWTGLVDEMEVVPSR